MSEHTHVPGALDRPPDADAAFAVAVARLDALGAVAVGLYLRSVAACHGLQGTEVPADEVRRWGLRGGEWLALVAAGLWVVVDGGFRVLVP